VSNHGDGEGFYLWGGGPRVAPEELAEPLRASAARKLLLFGQCFAGRFASLGATLGSAVICCACGEAEESGCVAPPGVLDPDVCDEFYYQLLGALAGRYPDGQPLSRAVGNAERVSV